jgi:hypothetical protein
VFSRPHLLRLGSALLLASLSIVAPAAGQLAGSQGPAERAVRATLEKVIPRWDESVLRVADKPDWSEKVTFDRVFQAMKDTPVKVERIPETAERIQDEGRSLRLDGRAGKVRYISRTRAWSFERDAKKPAIAAERALAAAQEALRSLEVPSDELEKPDVATQMAGGAPVGAREIQDRYEMYQIVTVKRRINQLPVYGSEARVAVNSGGEIQRALVKWPAFRLSPGLSLRQRSSVVEEAVRQILRQSPRADLKITAYLAYAPRDDDDRMVRYVPAVIVSVYAPPTPYQVVIDVAEPSGQPATAPRTP